MTRALRTFTGRKANDGERCMRWCTFRRRGALARYSLGECHREVRRLQARIVKATKEGRWGKVKALQWLLTHSFSGKALAVRRVTENQGKKTPGVDKVTGPRRSQKTVPFMTETAWVYKPRPLRRIYIPKSNGKMRPLGIPTMSDRAMQAFYLLALEPVSETLRDSHSYGFRPDRSTRDAIEQCFTALGKQASPQWILEGDIRGCFDEISHDWLITHVPTDKAILRKWLKAGYIEDRHLFPQTRSRDPARRHHLTSDFELGAGRPAAPCCGRRFTPSPKGRWQMDRPKVGLCVMPMTL